MTMVDSIIYMLKNHPNLVEFSFTRTEVIGEFKDGKIYSVPLTKFEDAVALLQIEFDKNNKNK